MFFPFLGFCRGGLDIQPLTPKGSCVFGVLCPFSENTCVNTNRNRQFAECIGHCRVVHALNSDVRPAGLWWSDDA